MSSRNPERERPTNPRPGGIVSTHCNPLVPTDKISQVDESNSSTLERDNVHGSTRLQTSTSTSRAPRRPSQSRGDQGHTIHVAAGTLIRVQDAEAGEDDIPTRIAAILAGMGEIPDLTGKVNILRTRNSIRGGPGLVHRGRFDGKWVAMKVSENSTREFDVSDKRRIDRELKIWATLKHRNISELLGYATDLGGYHAMISPWYKHGTAEQYLRSNPGLSLLERIRLMQDVADGLQYLHNLRLIHGDLNLSSIQIDADKVARLCDVGLASPGDPDRDSGMMTVYTGTIRYKAPEVWSSDEHPRRVVTFKGDIYALGCIILEFVGRIPPFNVKDLAAAIANRCRPASRPEWAAKLWTILDACCGDTDTCPRIGDIVHDLMDPALQHESLDLVFKPVPPPSPPHIPFPSCTVLETSPEFCSHSEWGSNSPLEFPYQSIEDKKRSARENLAYTPIVEMDTTGVVDAHRSKYRAHIVAYYQGLVRSGSSGRHEPAGSTSQQAKTPKRKRWFFGFLR